MAENWKNVNRVVNHVKHQKITGFARGFHGSLFFSMKIAKKYLFVENTHRVSVLKIFDELVLI